MRLGTMIALTVLSVAAPIGSAHAGIVVINFREAATSAYARGAESVLLNPASTSTSTNQAAPMIFAAPASESATGIDTGSYSSSDESAGTSTSRPKPPKLGDIRRIDDGLSYDDPEAVGCGGASATAGPAGFLPLAVAALALLRQRRLPSPAPLDG